MSVMGKWPAAAVLIAGCLGAARADGLKAIHPGFTSTDIQPEGRELLVGSLDFFSDGRMAVCTWGNPGEVWILQDPD